MTKPAIALSAAAPIRRTKCCAERRFGSDRREVPRAGNRQLTGPQGFSSHISGGDSLYPTSADMIDGLRQISAADCACKICGSPAPLYGVVDFHKSCEEARGVHFALSGVPIYYRRCSHCKFLFTDAFDDWTIEQFKAHIYNEEYKLVDPEYADVRPRANVGAVAQLWGPHKSETRVLDFGGGNDTLCAGLREAGFATAVTYDPMVPQYAERPAGRYDLITSFETFEHLPDPLRGIEAILEFAADPGLIFFTTLLQPTDFDQQRLNWWYVGPRNGHISLFSRQALTMAWERHGYRLASLGDNTHFAFRKLPPYLAHLQPPSLNTPALTCAA